MIWTSLDTWIVAAGVIASVSCALLGVYLVLRRMSMMGDAISHAVLPGIAIAFVVTDSRSSIAMFIGAAVVGVLTAVFTQWVHRLGRVESGAAMGVVFTTLFALGLILIVRGANSVDLDPECVLYGSVETTPLDTRTWLGVTMPRAVWVGSAMLLLNLAFVVGFYKELKISSFDPELATTQGINAALMQYLLMAMVAATTVASFEIVGSIIVIAMLIVPAAAAHLLTERLSLMLVFATVIAAASAVLGHIGAITIPPLFGYPSTLTSGMMAVTAGLLFVVAMVFAPRHGLLSRWMHRARFNFDMLKEDLLGLLWRLEEAGEADEGAHAPAILHEAMGVRRLTSALALSRLRREGAVQPVADHYELTDRGRSRAQQLVRTHRLWESYLDAHLRLEHGRAHKSAERFEHLTTAEMQQLLADETGHPERDPQGKPVPPSENRDA